MYQEFPPFSVKTIIFASGERCPAVVDATGMLAYDPNLYGVTVLRQRAGSSTTMEAHLRAIAMALNWASGRSIDFSARTPSVELLNTLEMEDLRDALRAVKRKPAANKGGVRKGTSGQRPVVMPGTLYNRCHMVRDYLVWHARIAIQRIRTDDAKLPEARDRLERFAKNMVANLPKPRSADKEGLSEAAQSLFLEVIRPDDRRNPFRSQNRHRNYALLLLFYETGMRRGEALKIKGEHLQLNGDHPTVRIVRDPDDPLDPRGIEPKVKTQPHEDPISHDLAQAMRAWVLTHRTDANRYPNAKRTPYVFVSRLGKPLGVRTVNDMFDLIEDKFPDLGPNLYAHILRHSANDRFSIAAEELGLNEAETRMARNAKFGWTKNSDQGERYNTRHARRRADEVVRRMQEKSSKGLNR